jgi:hypothetical protein
MQQVVAIRFYVFETESGRDVLSLYDGRSEAYSGLIATLSGMPNTPFNYYSTGEYMYIRFVTDSTVTKTGFSANFFSSDNPGKFEL